MSDQERKKQQEEILLSPEAQEASDQAERLRQKIKTRLEQGLWLKQSAAQEDSENSHQRELPPEEAELSEAGAAVETPETPELIESGGEAPAPEAEAAAEQDAEPLEDDASALKRSDLEQRLQALKMRALAKQKDQDLERKEAESKARELIQKRIQEKHLSQAIDEKTNAHQEESDPSFVAQRAYAQEDSRKDQGTDDRSEDAAETDKDLRPAPGFIQTVFSGRGIWIALVPAIILLLLILFVGLTSLFSPRVNSGAKTLRLSKPDDTDWVAIDPSIQLTLTEVPSALDYEKAAFWSFVDEKKVYEAAGLDAEASQEDREKALKAAKRSYELKGQGTKDHPFEISKAEDLAYLAEQLEGNYYSKYARAFYKQTADIVLNSALEKLDDPKNVNESLLKDLKNWKPLGSQQKPFQGEYDGGGHKVVGLYYARDAKGQIQRFAGFFSVLNHARVRNLNFEHALVLGRNHHGLGLLAGLALNGTQIEAVEAEGLVEGDSYVGGLIGELRGVSEPVQLKHIRFSGSVKAAAAKAKNDRAATEQRPIQNQEKGSENEANAKRLELKSESGIQALAGGVSAALRYAQIDQAKVAGSIESEGTAGALVAQAYISSEGEIRDFVNEAMVRAGQTASGVIGRLLVEADGSLRLDAVKNQGSIKGDRDAAGILGRAVLLGQMQKKQALIIVQNSAQGAEISGENAGGLFGRVVATTGLDFHIDGFTQTGKIQGKLLSGGLGADLSLAGGRLTVNGYSSEKEAKVQSGSADTADRDIAAGLIANVQVPHRSRSSFQIQNSAVDGEVKGRFIAGGLLGRVNLISAYEGDKDVLSSMELSHSLFYGQVKEAIHLGGLISFFDAGRVQDQASQAILSIHDCAVYGTLGYETYRSGTHVGGLCATLVNVPEEGAMPAYLDVSKNFFAGLFVIHDPKIDQQSIYLDDFLYTLRTKWSALGPNETGYHLEGNVALPYANELGTFHFATGYTRPKLLNERDTAEVLQSGNDIVSAEKYRDRLSYPSFDFNQDWLMDEASGLPVPRFIG